MVTNTKLSSLLCDTHFDDFLKLDRGCSEGYGGVCCWLRLMIWVVEVEMFESDFRK